MASVSTRSDSAQRGRLFPFSAESIKFTISKNYFKEQTRNFQRACTMKQSTPPGILRLCSPQRAQHPTILALSRKSTLQVPVATISNNYSPLSLGNQPERFLFCEQLLPLLVNLTLHLELNFAKLENNIFRLQRAVRKEHTNLLLLSAKLLLLEPHALSGKLLRENRRITENRAHQWRSDIRVLLNNYCVSEWTVRDSFSVRYVSYSTSCVKDLRSAKCELFPKFQKNFKKVK